MTLEIYIAVLLTIIVMALVAMTVALTLAFVQVKRAAAAVEQMAHRAGDQVGRVGEMAGVLGNLALGFAGGMSRKAALGAGLLFSLLRVLRHRRKKEEISPEDEPEKGGSDE